MEHYLQSMDRRVESIVMQKTANIQHDMEVKWALRVQDLERRLFETNDKLQSHRNQAESGYRKQMKSEMASLRRELEEKERDNQYLLKELERRSRLSESVQQQLKAEIAEVSSRDYAAVQVESRKLANEVASFRQENQSLKEGTQRQLDQLARQMDQQAMMSNGSILELRKVVDSLMTSEQTTLNSLMGKSKRMLTQLQDHYKKQIDMTLAQLHGEWSELRQATVRSREDYTALAKQVSELTKAKGMGVGQEELEHLERRLLELQGPTLSAVGQLQQQVGMFEQHFANLTQMDKKAKEIIEYGENVSNKLSQDVQQKWDFFHQSCQNQLNEWEQRIARFETQAQLVDKERRDFEATMFTKFSDFEDEHREWKHKRRSRDESVLDSFKEELKKDRSSLAKRMEEYVANLHSWQKDCREELTKKQEEAVDQLQVLVSRSEENRDARDERVKSYTQKAVQSVQKQMQEMQERLGAMEKKAPEQHQSLEQMVQEAEGRWRQRLEHVMEEERAEIRQTVDFQNVRVKAVELAVAESSGLMERLDKEWQQRVAYEKADKQEFESGITLKLEKSWEDFTALAQQVRAEEDKRERQAKVREDEARREYAELERRVVAQLEAIMQDLQEREERRLAREELKEERLKADEEHEKIKIKAEVDARDERLKHERAEMERRLMAGLSELMKTVQEVSEQSTTQQQHEDLSGRIELLKRFMESESRAIEQRFEQIERTFGTRVSDHADQIKYENSLLESQVLQKVETIQKHLAGQLSEEIKASKVSQEELSRRLTTTKGELEEAMRADQLELDEVRRVLGNYRKEWEQQLDSTRETFHSSLEKTSQMSAEMVRTLEAKFMLPDTSHVKQADLFTALSEERAHTMEAIQNQLKQVAFAHKKPLEIVVQRLTSLEDVVSSQLGQEIRFDESKLAAQTKSRSGVDRELMNEQLAKMAARVEQCASKDLVEAKVGSILQLDKLREEQRKEEQQKFNSLYSDLTNQLKQLSQHFADRSGRSFALPPQARPQPISHLSTAHRILRRSFIASWTESKTKRAGSPRGC